MRSPPLYALHCLVNFNIFVSARTHRDISDLAADGIFKISDIVLCGGGQLLVCTASGNIAEASHIFDHRFCSVEAVAGGEVDGAFSVYIICNANGNLAWSAQCSRPPAYGCRSGRQAHQTGRRGAGAPLRRRIRRLHPAAPLPRRRTFLR